MSDGELALLDRRERDYERTDVTDRWWSSRWSSWTGRDLRAASVGGRSVPRRPRRIPSGDPASYRRVGRRGVRSAGRRPPRRVPLRYSGARCSGRGLPLNVGPAVPADPHRNVDRVSGPEPRSAVDSPHARRPRLDTQLIDTQLLDTQLVDTQLIDDAEQPIAQPTGEERRFRVVSDYEPAGDQPKAIAAARCGSRGRRAVPDPARHHRFGQVGHDGVDDRAGRSGRR